MRIANSEIIVLGEYVRSNKKIRVLCKKCGHIWYPVAGSLLLGHGCPKCSHPSTMKTNDTFVEQMQECNPNIEPLETYRGKDTKIRFKCKICGKEWETRPSQLLRGGKCPNCLSKEKSERRKKSPEQYRIEVSKKIRTFHCWGNIRIHEQE